MATIETPKVVLTSERFPWFSDATRTQIKEYVPTLLTELAVMVSQIIAYKLAAHYLGKQGFSEYAIARRTISLIIPIPMLGLTVGLPRYIGFSKGRRDPASADRHFGATLWCVGVGALICVFLINCFPSTFGYLFFGNVGYASFARPFGLMIMGLCVHTVVCGYFRGHLRLNQANVMQFLDLVIAPVLVFFLFRHSVVMVLNALGTIWCVVACGSLLFTPFSSIARNSSKEMSELLRYGIQRVPGDLILMALFTLPSTLLVHLRGIQEAGFVAFGISVVAMVGAIFAPLGLVLLPKATLMLAQGAKRDLREHVRPILRATVAASLAISIIIWLWIPNLVRLYLGPDYSQVVPIVRVLLAAALPYSLYLVFRSLVDAYHEFGMTAAILAVGLTLFLTGSYIGKHFSADTTAILLSFFVAQAAIATLSGLECRRILHD